MPFETSLISFILKLFRYSHGNHKNPRLVRRSLLLTFCFCFLHLFFSLLEMLACFSRAFVCFSEGGVSWRRKPNKEYAMQLPVALYVPNLLGYARIGLAFAGLHYAATTRPWAAICLWVASGFLDLLDGILARALRQTSSLGVFLDIAADNILRTVTWLAVAVAVAVTTSTSTLSDSTTTSSAVRIQPNAFCCCFIICLEWTTMVSTQVHAAQNSQHWKEARSKDPWIIRTYFASNFRNPLGFLGIYGLFASSIFAFGYHHSIVYDSIPFYDVFMYLAFVGRFVSAAIELWFCASYFAFLIEKDSPQKRSE